MSVQPIRLFPDSALRKPCQPVDRFDASLQKIARDLIHTMKHQRHGIGIAAPQIGINKQVAVVDVSARVSGTRQLILVNPRILAQAGEKISREGCMSVPDYMANLKRYDQIRLEWQDVQGIPYVREFQGIEAICIQHELDHLDGKLFIDRVVSLKRDMIPRQR